MAKTFDEVQALNGTRTKVRLTIEVEFFVHPDMNSLRDAIFLTAPDVAKEILVNPLTNLCAEASRLAAPRAIIFDLLQHGKLETPPEEHTHIITRFHMSEEVLPATEEEFTAAANGAQQVFKLRADGSKDEVHPVIKVEGDARSEPIEP